MSSNAVFGLRSHAVAFALVMGFAPAVIGQVAAPVVWHAVAHTGAVDAAHQSLYQTHATGSVSIKSHLANAKVVVRFQVSGIGNVRRGPYDPDSDGPDQRIQFAAVLRDTGDGARVVVRLRSLERDSGSIRTLATIDSNVGFFAAGINEYRTEFAYLRVPQDFYFDYWHYAYFVEAELTKTTAAANPGLKNVQICNPAGSCQEGI